MMAYSSRVACATLMPAWGLCSLMSCTALPASSKMWVWRGIAAQMQRLADPDAPVARHDDAQVLPGRAARMDQRLRAHRLDQFGRGREGVGAALGRPAAGRVA